MKRADEKGIFISPFLFNIWTSLTVKLVVYAINDLME